MAFPGAEGQCLESPFSRCSDLSTVRTVFGEWKPLVSPMSCCGSESAFGWSPMPSSSPLWLATNFIEERLKGLWASDSFSCVSSSPGGHGWLKGEYLSSDNEGPLGVLESISLLLPSSSFSLPGSVSSEWTMTSASTWLLHTDVHRWSDESCNTKSHCYRLSSQVTKTLTVFWLSSPQAQSTEHNEHNDITNRDHHISLIVKPLLWVIFIFPVYEHKDTIIVLP